MILPTLAAVVALIAGHPVPVTCDADAGTLGSAWLASTQPTVQLSPYVCSTWTRMRRGIPDESWLAAIGQDLTAAVHEGEHVRYSSYDEALTECRTLRDLPAVVAGIVGNMGDALGRYLAQRWTAAIIAYALVVDAETPAQYHGAVC